MQFPRNSLHFSVVLVTVILGAEKLARLYLKEIGVFIVRSLKIGLRGWNDYEMPMVHQDRESQVIGANADKYCTP